jgi:hypothetical protein
MGMGGRRGRTVVLGKKIAEFRELIAPVFERNEAPIVDCNVWG